MTLNPFMRMTRKLNMKGNVAATFRLRISNPPLSPLKNIVVVRFIAQKIIAIRYSLSAFRYSPSESLFERGASSGELVAGSEKRD